MKTDQIIRRAEWEYQAELERQLIDEEKRRLRAKGNRTFWERIFPWKITITRRNYDDRRPENQRRS